MIFVKLFECRNGYNVKELKVLIELFQKFAGGGRSPRR